MTSLILSGTPVNSSAAVGVLSQSTEKDLHSTLVLSERPRGQKQQQQQKKVYIQRLLKKLHEKKNESISQQH